MVRMLAKIILVLVISTGQIAIAAPLAKILNLSGDVKVRRGLDETWQPARPGILLEEIDTILSLEGMVTLEIEEGVIFRLGSNSILDIGDLRKITKREMFLFLMSEKVDRINPRTEKTRLRVGNVSVVHGESKAESAEMTDNQDSQKWIQEFNGAKALYDHDYHTNTIVKLNKIFNKHSVINDCGEIHFYLGATFEKLNEPGQAVDAYQIAIERGQNCGDSKSDGLIQAAREAIERLKK